MNKPRPNDEITADEAKDILKVGTREAVVRLIERKVIKSARKLNPKKRTSPYVMSRAEVVDLYNTRQQKKKQRGQAAKTD